MKYTVKVSYLYSDTMEIEAASKEEAETLALSECDEQCELLHDIESSELA